MRGRHLPKDEEIDFIGTQPRVGEVWWCEGTAIGLNDGGKTRPVLVVGVSAGEARVMPLTSHKPDTGQAVSVAHRGGLSWLVGTGNQARSLPTVALISSLGAWSGFSVWRKNSG